MKRKYLGMAAAVLGILMLGMAGLWYYMQTATFMEAAGSTAASVASDALGVRVDVGDIEVKSLHTLEIHNLAVYDKQAEVIARAEKAQVTCRLLSVLSAPADAVREIKVSGVEAFIEQRADGSWNYEDLMSETGSSQQFHGLVKVENARLTGRMQGAELTLTDMDGSLDFADYPVMKVRAAAKNQGAEIEVSGTIDDVRQIINLQVRNADIMNYIGLLPQGTLPEAAEIKNGRVSQGTLHVFRDGSRLSFSGTADFADGAVRILDTEITDIQGHASFTDADLLLSAEAEANGQMAKAHGRIRLDTGSPYMDLAVSAKDFDPGKILQNIPYQGAADFEAKVTGTFESPAVEGTVKAGSGSSFSVPFQNLSAKVRYQDDHLFVQDFRVDALGGHAEGELALSAKDLGYTAHIRARGIDMAQAASVAPQAAGVMGHVSCDVGLSGTGTDFSAMQAYGNAKLQDGSYRELPIDSLNASFYLAGESLTLDFLSLNLPHKSSLGIEGTIEQAFSAPVFDLAFYGAHFDLSLLRILEPKADLTGFSDFKGTISGSADNPQVDIKCAGLQGTLFKQPFDSLKFAVSGSLDGVHIDDFLMEKDGKEVWRVAGSAGFAGERRLNLQIDTMGARMEDIAALVAPDQPITGNVDNIIKFTGTLDNPKGVGYIHFYRGSYHGMLLSGMDGDYFLENGVVRLQDFHAYSPMIDMDLNGTIEPDNTINMEVKAADIDLKRMEHKLPYEVSGHGTFQGQLFGKIDKPEFHGILESPSLMLNGQEIVNLHGLVSYRNGVAAVDQFGFEQNGGSFDLAAAVNTETNALSGDVVIQNADVNALAAMLNQKNDFVQGKLSCSAELGGTTDNPAIALFGGMEQGTAGGYDIHGVNMDLRLRNHILYINTLSGEQGQNGKFSASGHLNLDNGPVQVKFSASNLAMGILTKAAGIDAQVIGTEDVEAVIGGVLSNPAADVTVHGSNGGVQGAAFDDLEGVFRLKNGLIHVDTLTVAKTVGEKTHRASAKGIVPMRAVFAGQNEELNDIEQIQLTVSLDQADLSLLPTLSREVDWAIGATTGTLKIRGTLAHPLFEGNIGLAGGAVKLKALEKPLSDMNADIALAGSRMTVREFSGKMGDGTYSLKGELELNGTAPEKYDFSFTADNLDIQSKFFRGPLNGRIRIFDTEFYGQHLPKISGSVDFHDCLVSVPAIPDSDGQLPEAVLDVQVDVGKKVHFYSSYLYDLYLTGQVHAGGIISHPKMSGSLSVKHGGTINYLKTEFKIREGIANFDQVASFLPSIDFQADTKMASTKIFLAAKGALGQIDFKLTSSPEMSQTQIIQMLTLRGAGREGQEGFSAADLLSIGLQMSVLSEVEDAMRNFLYLDLFSISRGNGSAFDRRTEETLKDQYDFNVQMGKYVTENVMLKYTKGLGGDNINRYGVMYDINDRIGLTMERESGGYIIGLEARTKF